MKVHLKMYISLVLCLGMGSVLSAQLPDQLELTLSDKTKVKLCRQSNDRSSSLYYYLPVNFRISEKKGQSEFSFLTYRKDSLAPITGGIMHMLMEWGLNKNQLEEAREQLRLQLDSTAILAGSVFLSQDSAHPSVEIISKNSLGEVLMRSIKNSARTPLQSGAKLATSFSFSAEDAKVMAEALEKPKKLKDIVFRIYFTANDYRFRGCVPPSFYIDGNLDKWIKELK